MKLKKSLIAGMIPLLLTGSILAGCSGGQSQTAINNAQETTTASENNSSNETDDKIYNIVEYVQSGKPFFLMYLQNADDKNKFFKYPDAFKDNKLYLAEGGYDTSDINITLGDYSNMTDDEFFDLLNNSKIYQKSYPGCFVVNSDKSGNNLNEIYFCYKNPDVSDSDKPYLRYYLFHLDEYPIERGFDVYDSSFVEAGYSFRSNKPFKTIGTLEDYKNMDGVLVDPTKDEIKAALGI